MAGRGRLVPIGAALVAVAAVVVLLARGCHEDDGDPAPHRDEAPIAVSDAESAPSRVRRRRDADSSALPPTNPEVASDTRRSMGVRVRDETGAAVSGVVVLCGNPAELQKMPTTSGTDGVARFEDVAAGPVVVQWAMSNRAAQDRLDLGSEAGWTVGVRVVERAQDLEVVVERLHRLGGTATRRDGLPLEPDVRLTLEPANSTVPLEPRRSGVEANPAASPSGEFEFLVEAGLWFIHLRRSGAADDLRFGPFEAGKTDLHLVVDEGPRIEGRVETPEGAPACGWMWFERDGPWHPTPFRSGGSSGFESPVLQVGAVYDVIGRGDRERANGTVWALLRSVAAGTSGVVLRAQPGRTIRARVVDARQLAPGAGRRPRGAAAGRAAGCVRQHLGVAPWGLRDRACAVVRGAAGRRRRRDEVVHAGPADRAGGRLARRHDRRGADGVRERAPPPRGRHTRARWLDWRRRPVRDGEQRRHVHLRRPHPGTEGRARVAPDRRLGQGSDPSSTGEGARGRRGPHAAPSVTSPRPRAVAFPGMRGAAGTVAFTAGGAR